MSGYTAKSLDELPSLWDGFAQLVRPGLEITAFGANIMNLPPDYSTKSHDESESGQQELYVALQGSGSVDIGDERLPLDAEHLVKVDPGTARVVSSGSGRPARPVRRWRPGRRVRAARVVVVRRVRR